MTEKIPPVLSDEKTKTELRQILLKSSPSSYYLFEERQLDEICQLIQQTQQDKAREMIEEIERQVKQNLSVISQRALLGSSWWQSLKAKYPKG